MRVLVTGGSGFIGSHVVDKLRARGHEPVIYDLRPSPWHERGTVDTVLGSITDREALERALHSCDAVAHLAAVADVNDVHAEPEDAERVNARGTVAVLEAARRAGVKRIVYASTIWVYSDCEPEEVDEDTLLPPPSHLYTSTKLAGELYCKAYQELYGIDYTILRFGIPYGPRAREAAVIPAFVNKAFEGRAADAGRRRHAVAPVRLRRGPRRRRRARARRRRRQPRLQPGQRRERHDQADRRDGQGADRATSRSSTRRPGPATSAARSSPASAPSDELGWTAATPFSEGVRRYIEWRREQAEAPSADEEQAAVIPAGEPDAEAKPRQVLIISADIGEGHDLPARAVAREFRDEDPDALVSIVNGLPAMGPILTKMLRENSAVHVPRGCRGCSTSSTGCSCTSRPTRWLARRLLTCFGRRGLMRLIRAHDPDLIVSTYPGVTAVLGELRRNGRLNVPCYSSITDLAGLQFWAHPGIDLHFITHPESAEEVERIAGPGSVRWAKPPTSPAFLAARSRADARRALGLPAEGRVIAVSGGGWGVGDLAGATRAALDVRGRDRALPVRAQRQAPRQGGASASPASRGCGMMGFTDRMGDVLAAADALVHSSAGLTVLEAIIRGCPVVSYGFGVRPRARLQRRAGALRAGPGGARRARELGPAIARALEQHPEPDASFARRPSTASLILTDERRARPLPAWRLRTARAATTLAARGRARRLGADHRRLVLARLALRPHPPDDRGGDDRPEVGVLIDAPGGQIPALASTLAAYGIHASFAVDSAGSPPARACVRATATRRCRGCPTGGLVRWLGTRGAAAPADRRRWAAATTSSMPRAARASASGCSPTAPAAGSSPAPSGCSDADDALGRSAPGRGGRAQRRQRPVSCQHVLGKLVCGLASASSGGRAGRAADARRRRGGVTDGRAGTATLASTRRRPRAAARLDGVARRTPVLGSRTLERSGPARRVALKAETFQRGGAFKFRGAYNAISSLDGGARARGRVRGVLGQPRRGGRRWPRGCARRGRRSSCPPTRRRSSAPRPRATAPRSSPSTATATIVSSSCAQLAAERGLALVHPYDNPHGDGRTGDGGAGAARAGRRARRAARAGRRRRADLRLRHRRQGAVARRRV